MADLLSALALLGIVLTLYAAAGVITSTAVAWLSRHDDPSHDDPTGWH